MDLFDINGDGKSDAFENILGILEEEREMKKILGGNDFDDDEDEFDEDDLLDEDEDDYFDADDDDF